MDRKCGKKIKKYVGAYLIFAVLFSVFLYLMGSYEVSLERQRMTALLARHPELDAEIIRLWEKPADDRLQEAVTAEAYDAVVKKIEEQYGYRIGRSKSAERFLIFWGAGMLVGAVFTVCLGYLERRRKENDFEHMFNKVGECLRQFQRGNFRQIPEHDDVSEEWLNLWETLRELGVYFEGLKARLKEEEDSTKALITDISHQLKTPLASLRMSHELITDGDVSEEERREFQEQEAKEIEKLEALLSELVNLSRLEKRMIQIKPVPASLKNTVTEAVGQIYMKAKYKQIELQVEMERDIEVCHDTKWTVEAFANVLDNAVKYSPEHTQITVRVYPLVKNVLIEIEDEGMGIGQEELAKIYQRFYRGEKAKETVQEGAGVGLYLSRMILERQGGTISAKRRIERGTVFKITLPC